MSTTSMDASNNSVVAKYLKKSWVERYQQGTIGFLVQSGVIYDASKEFRGDRGRGDSVTFDYIGKLTQSPLGEGQTAFGNEEALNTGNHNMVVNVTRIPVSNYNNQTIEQQRTNIQFDQVTAETQTGRAMELMDTSAFNQLAGFNPTSFTVNGTTYATASSKLQVQGHNTPVAPTSDRIIRAGGAANDQALTSSDTMTLDLLDQAYTSIVANDQPIAPCSDGYFKALLHPYQVRDLRKDTSGKIQWYQIQLAKESGNQSSNLEFSLGDKPVYMGSYLNVKIYQAPRVCQGVNSSNNSVVTTARRAVLVGRDALSYASPFGGISPTDTTVPFKLYTELSDYDYVKGMDLRTIYGLKKMTPSNAQDMGSFVISTYAAA